MAPACGEMQIFGREDSGCLRDRRAPHAQSRPRLRGQAIGFRSSVVRVRYSITVHTDGNTSCRPGCHGLLRWKDKPTNAGWLLARGGHDLALALAGAWRPDRAALPAARRAAT